MGAWVRVRVRVRVRVEFRRVGRGLGGRTLGREGVGDAEGAGKVENKRTMQRVGKMNGMGATAIQEIGRPTSEDRREDTERTSP